MWFFFACSPDPETRKSQADTPAVTDSGRDSDTDADTDSDSDADTDTDSDTDTSWTLPVRPDTDHPNLTDSWRWGGGVGYPDRVDPSWPVVVRVTTLAELTAALSVATAGQIVYVEDDAEIDLTGQSLCIPGGVWLASDRGIGAGGLLYSTEGASASVLRACGTDVRVTGLRIRGPDPENCPSEWPDHCPNDVSGDSNCAYCTTTAYGISTDGQAGLEVDNNEMSGWTYAAVGVKNAVNADVHHNWIHHDWREGLGYGVVIYGTGASSALIRWNRFDAMRHAVAGQGYAQENYEARDNLMGDAAIGHIFDMHGENEATGSGSSNAGGDIRVHRNIVLTADQYSFVVRGKPVVGAWLYENCLAPSSSDAYDQRYFSGNFYVDQAPDGTKSSNQYGQRAGDCGTLHWCLADGVTGPLHYGSASGTPASDLLIGDLNGDGKDDVFGTTGTGWRWANPDGGSWSALATSGAALSNLALADLDGDGVDDVVQATGSEWDWSKSGSASWAKLKASTVPLSQIRFGDFDGDGAMDIFTTDGSRWSYAPKGSGTAVNLASSGNSISDLALGDFDGDGVTDVFTGDGTNWKWSRSGTASWANLAVSSSRVSSLMFADVDGDHITDVVSQSGNTLRFSSGGRSSWKVLGYHREGPLLFGDFDGDGRADLLTDSCL